MRFLDKLNTPSILYEKSVDRFRRTAAACSTLCPLWHAIKAGNMRPSGQVSLVRPLVVQGKAESVPAAAPLIPGYPGDADGEPSSRSFQYSDSGPKILDR
ncbi:hypothetical protein J31TS4_29330 [Paenibacillus sp. J31TS4]|nr:hypothetical protein J31TS4_29330 [Paenibacillus sp. J31TS4]